jgi:hypothetical protein
MAYVPVPKDLSAVKTKIILNLTKRQLICFSTAAVIGVPTYFLTRGLVGTTTAVLVMIGLMLPFFFIAMYERDGQPAEVVLRNFIRVKLWPAARPYKTENLYEYLEQEGKSIAQQDTAAKAATCKKCNISKTKTRNNKTKAQTTKGRV